MHARISPMHTKGAACFKYPASSLHWEVGGDLGPLTKKRKLFGGLELIKAAFELKPGEMSKAGCLVIGIDAVVSHHFRFSTCSTSGRPYLLTCVLLQLAVSRHRHQTSLHALTGPIVVESGFASITRPSELHTQFSHSSQRFIWKNCHRSSVMSYII
eukprot:5509657-Amphidinium_carterae.1